jgi:hypothetical protein
VVGTDPPTGSPNDASPVTVTATTRRTAGRPSRRGHWRLDASGRHRRGYPSPHAAGPEPYDFELCLALLEEAIARAERWFARRERALAEFDLHAVDAVRRLRSAGVLGLSPRGTSHERDAAGRHSVVMTASALLRHGPEHAGVLLDGLSEWMARKGFETVDQLRGLLSAAPGGDAAERERAGYVNAMRAANASPYGSWS